MLSLDENGLGKRSTGKFNLFYLTPSTCATHEGLMTQFIATSRDVVLEELEAVRTVLEL